MKRNMRKKTKKKTITVFSIIIVILIVIIYFVTLLVGNAKSGDEDVLLREYPVTRGDITAGTDGSGALSLSDTPQNYDAPVKLKEIYVEQGDYIKKGDKISEASKDDLDQKLHDLEIELSKARITLKNAKNAKTTGAVDSDSNAETSSSEQNKSLQAEELKNAVTLAEIDVDELNRKIKQTEELLNNLVLIADCDGLVLSVNYTKGSETGETPVISIGDTEDMSALLQVTQSDIVDIENGQTVELRFDAFPEKVFAGIVEKKSSVPQNDSNPVTYPVTVSIDKEDYELLHGMTCNAQFIIKQAKDVLMISNKAIKLVDGKQVVLLKNEEGELYEAIIETGFSDGKFSEVLTGLDEGQIVYVEG